MHLPLSVKEWRDILYTLNWKASGRNIILDIYSKKASWGPRERSRGVRRLSWLIYCCHPQAREILPEMRIKEQCDQLRTAVTTATSTKQAERKTEPTQQKAGDAAHFSWSEHFQKAVKGVCVRASPQQWRWGPACSAHCLQEGCQWGLQEPKLKCITGAYILKMIFRQRGIYYEHFPNPCLSLKTYRSSTAFWSQLHTFNCDSLITYLHQLSWFTGELIKIHFLCLKKGCTKITGCKVLLLVGMICSFK